jgi:hypothetical protein
MARPYSYDLRQKAVADCSLLFFLNRGAPPSLLKNRWYASSKCRNDC